MGDGAARSRPNARQLVRYCVGARLPDSMRDWVRNDLAGKGATRRMIHQACIDRYGPRPD